MKNKTLNIFSIVLILLGAFALRFLFLDKPSGFWYDELVTFNQIMLPSVKDVFLNVIETDIHFPLYQILLHYWVKVLGNSELIIRLFSVVVGTLACFVAYFTGNKKQGLICMLLFAINSFLIYYSQEARMYSLLVLFSTLNIVSLLKIEQTQKKWAYSLWVLSSLGMIYTFLLSIIYVAIQVVAYVIYRWKEDKKAFIFTALGTTVLCLPLVIIVALKSSTYSTYVHGFYTDFSSLFVMLQNFFTPMLLGIGTNPVHYAGTFFRDINLYSLLYVFIPMCIALFFIVKSAEKDKFNLCILISAIAYIVVLVLLFVFGNFNILSRFAILLVPSLLVLFVRGMDSNLLSKILLVAYLLVNALYLAIFDDAAFKLEREGYKQVGEFVNSVVNDGDYLILWNRTEILDKYLTKKVDKKGVLSDFAYKSEYILDNEDKLSKMSVSERKEFLRKYFIEERYPMNTLMLYSFMYGRAKAGTKFVLVTNKFFEEYNYKKFIIELGDDESYEYMSYNNLMTLKSMIAVKQLIEDSLKFVKKQTFGNTVVYIYQK